MSRIEREDARVTREGRLRLLDLSPPAVDLVDEALRGLSATPKTLPSKLLYDEVGSALFERITQLDAYYPTRTERAILEARMPDIAELVGADAWVVEMGSGSCTKTRQLLAGLHDPRVLTVVDISRAALVESARALSRRFPALEITGVVGDYTRPLALPRPVARHARKLGFFPGSTIGNFARDEGVRFLERFGALLGPGALLLVGFDRVKDPRVLLRAYDDEEGVTARFDLNVLARLDAAGADFDLRAFRHEARWNAAERRIEMHLVSLRRQTVTLAGRRFHFDEGESICTEHCHKFDDHDLERLAASAGLRIRARFSDPREAFSLVLFEVEATPRG
ncbi:MAG: L-histidine N(alpha)-methyltransferase [Myxococcales bacterium]|nr:L-histidine N(alpha)-methyltransferase [Myxococcales bacterium]